MKKHHLKTWPEHFSAVVGLVKTFEYRLDDREYETGDQLILEEWSPDPEYYTGRSALLLVTHIVRGGAVGIPPGYCVMSTRILSSRDYDGVTLYDGLRIAEKRKEQLPIVKTVGRKEAVLLFAWLSEDPDRYLSFDGGYRSETVTPDDDGRIKVIMNRHEGPRTEVYLDEVTPGTFARMNVIKLTRRY